MKRLNKNPLFLPAVFGLLFLLVLGARQTLMAAEEEQVIVEKKVIAIAGGESAFLGIVPRGLDHVMRAALGFEDPGILLGEVLVDEAAAEAGLKVGDILTKLDGTPLHDPDRLISLLKEHKPGDVVKLDYIRQGKKKSVEVTLGSRPAMSWHGSGPMDIDIDLQGLEGLEGLKGLEGLRALEGLEGLKGLKVLSTMDCEGVTPQVEVIEDGEMKVVKVQIELDDPGNGKDASFD